MGKKYILEEVEDKSFDGFWAFVVIILLAVFVGKACVSSTSHHVSYVEPAAPTNTESLKELLK